MKVCRSNYYGVILGVYDSVEEASLMTGVSKEKILEVIDGVEPSYNGELWDYCAEVTP